MLTGKCAVDHPLKVYPASSRIPPHFQRLCDRWMTWEMELTSTCPLTAAEESPTDHPVSRIFIITLRDDLQVLILCRLTELIAYINIPTLLESWLSIYE